MQDSYVFAGKVLAGSCLLLDVLFNA